MASTEQVSCDLGGEAALLNLKSGVYYGLNPVGAYIWGLLAEPVAVRELCSQLEQAYEVEPARCEEEVLALLSEMAGHKLIEVREETATQA